MLIIILYTGETLLISHSQKVGTTISLIPSSETLISRREVWEGSQGPEQYLHRAGMSGALAQQKSIVSSTFLVHFFFFYDPIWESTGKAEVPNSGKQNLRKGRPVCLDRSRHVSFWDTYSLSDQQNSAAGAGPLLLECIWSSFHLNHKLFASPRVPRLRQHLCLLLL